MTKFTGRTLVVATAAALATAFAAGGVQAANSTDVLDLNLPTTRGEISSHSGTVGQGSIFDLDHPANLVVFCDIDGTEHAVGSFEVCDVAGGNAVAAEV